MPVTFIVNQEMRTVQTTALGALNADDFITHLRALVSAGVIAYPQMIDAREANVELTSEDVRMFVALLKRLREVYGATRTGSQQRMPWHDADVYDPQ